MYLRQPLLMIGHFFLALAFLFTPIVDNMHAIKMLGGETADLQNPADLPQHGLAMTTQAPCHEATMVPTEATLTQSLSAPDTNIIKPCCPYDECSPDNCLMHMAMASLSTLEVSPHSPIDHRTFLANDIHLVSMPFTERLRPPIA